MSRPASICILLLACVVAAFSQTQLWDLALGDRDNPNDGYRLDNAGNAFIATPHLTRKISPGGSELWQRNFGGSLVVDALGNVCVQDGAQVRKYSPAGDSLWTYDLGAWECGEVFQYYHLSLDFAGRLYIFNQCTKELTKLSSDGVRQWTVVLPLFRMLTDRFGHAGRIQFDRNGNGYIPFEDRFTAASGGPDLVGMMKVRPDGSISWRTTWPSDIRSNQENFTTVRFKEYSWGVTNAVVDSSGNSYLAGTEFLEVDRNSSMGEYQSVIGRWRITRLNTFGEENTRIIKGPGKVVTRTRVGREISTTALNETAVHNIALRGDQLLVYGAIDERKRSRGSIVGLLVPTVAQFNGTSTHPVWKTKLPPNRFGAPWELLLTHPSKAFFIPSQLNTIPPAAHLIRIDTGGVAQIASEEWTPAQTLFDWRTASLDASGNLFVLGLGEGGLHLVKYSNTTFSPLAGMEGYPSRLPEPGLSGFTLSGNYPNPFNPATTIEFALERDALITARVYNTLGQEVAVLANKEEFTEGINDLEFDASNLPSGVYYCRIVVEGLDGMGMLYSNVKKMMLVK